jgi:hypothetical protein
METPTKRPTRQGPSSAKGPRQQQQPPPQQQRRQSSDDVESLSTPPDEMEDRFSPPGANVIKLFWSVTYRFSHLARVFVRLGLKSLPRTNTLAYYENS